MDRTASDQVTQAVGAASFHLAQLATLAREKDKPTFPLYVAYARVHMMEAIAATDLVRRLMFSPTGRPYVVDVSLQHGALMGSTTYPMGWR